MSLANNHSTQETQQSGKSSLPVGKGSASAKAGFSASAPPAKARYHVSALFLLLCLGMIWGSGYSIAHFATTHQVPPLGYAFWQALGPAIAMSLCMLLGRLRFSRHVRSCGLYLLSGLIGIALPNTAIYFAAAHLPAGLLSVVVNTVPLFTFLFALYMREEAFCKWRLLAVLMCLLGLGLLFMPHSVWVGTQLWHWFALAMIAPLCFAACAVAIARYQPADCSAISLATGMLWSATLWLLPIIMLTHDFYALRPPWQLRDAAIIIEIVLSSIGYIILCRLLRLAGSVYYSLVGGVVACVGLLWGWVLFSEHLSFQQGMAVACIVLSIFLLSLLPRTPHRQSTATP